MKTQLYFRGIETKFIGPTNFKGSRISVRWADGCGTRKIYHWRSELNSDKNHMEAAKRFYMDVSDYKEKSPETQNSTRLEGGWTKNGAVFCIRYDNT